MPSVPALVFLGMTGALALACFTKVCGVVFLGQPRSAAAARAHECGPLMLGPMVVLAGACLAIGLAPTFFFRRRWRARLQSGIRRGAPWKGLRRSGRSGSPMSFSCWSPLCGVAALAAVSRTGLRRAPTWDCGYAMPTARMQYTAGSFASIINEWFAWILRPWREEHRPEGTFPAGASLVRAHAGDRA